MGMWDKGTVPNAPTVENATKKYHDEKLLVNKQMIKTGLEDIPDIPGLKAAIEKKQSREDFLVDLKKIHKAYARSASQEGTASNRRIQQPDTEVKTDYSLKSGTTPEQAEMSDAETKYSIGEEDPPKKTGVAYKVFYAKDGKLYPPMVANPGGEGTPVGVWLNADIGLSAAPSKTGRAQVQAGGKGTSTGKGSLAFRPGWHLGDIPHATQFARTNPETGKKELFPVDFVWAECEYAMDEDYQEEAMSYGYTENGKFRHSYAGKNGRKNCSVAESLLKYYDRTLGD